MARQDAGVGVYIDGGERDPLAKGLWEDVSVPFKAHTRWAIRKIYLEGFRADSLV